MTENLPNVPSAEVQSLPGVSIVGTAPASVTLTVVGEVDTLGTPVLDAALDVVWGDDPRDLVVDLTDVTFISVSALHSLLRTRKTAQQRAVHLSLWPHSRQMERLLGYAGASDVTRGAASSVGAGGPAREDAVPPDGDLPGRP